MACTLSAREIDVDLAQRLHGVGMHPRARLRARSPIAGTSWTTPVSLLASITETMPVGSCSAASTSSRSISPSAVDGKLAHFPARARKLLRRLRDAGMLDRAHGDLRRFQITRGAFDEQVVRFGAAGDEDDLRTAARPTSAATCSRAAFTACRARVPSSWRLDALPYCSRRNGSIASSTRSSSGRRRVVVEINVCHVRMPSEPDAAP